MDIQTEIKLVDEVNMEQKNQLKGGDAHDPLVYITAIATALTVIVVILVVLL